MIPRVYRIPQCMLKVRGVQDPEMIELYGKIAWLTIIMWSFYPVVWLFSEGFASFSVSFEVWTALNPQLLTLNPEPSRTATRQPNKQHALSLPTHSPRSAH